MITETVSFRIKSGMTRDDVLHDAHGTVARWTGFPGLIRKTFVMADPETAMGIYLWETKSAALAGHDEAWLRQAEAHWGNRPQIAYFDTLMELDARSGAVVENDLEPVEP